MKKVFSLILCSLACVFTVSAQKSSSSSRTEREFKRAAREWKKELNQFEKEANARAARWEKEERAARKTESTQSVPMLPPVNLPREPLPLPVASKSKPRRPARTAGLNNPNFLPPFTVRNSPASYLVAAKDKHSQRYRATDPAKVRAREEKGYKDKLVNQYRFPFKLGAGVYDVNGKRLGILAPAVRLNVGGVKKLVQQQITINKNEEHRLRRPGKAREPFEMAVGVKLTNGQRVSGLVRRYDIPVNDRPKQAPPKKLRAPGGATVPFYITGGAPFAPPDLRDRVTNKPLKFKDPNKNPPRGFVGLHQEGNDYLPRPINKVPRNARSYGDRFYVNVLRSLPGQGGIARAVVEINRKDKRPPIIDIYALQSARSRKLYPAGQRDPKTSLVFFEGRLRGQGRSLGPVLIAAPNLSNRVPQRRP